jgi:hypothetical protein
MPLFGVLDADNHPAPVAIHTIILDRHHSARQRRKPKWTKIAIRTRRMSIIREAF